MEDVPKSYDPSDSTLKFVNRKDEITGDDTPDVLRVEMSCGHAVDPNSLTGWCRSLMDQGHFIFYCPAVNEGTEEKCDKQWSYVEVRRHALLTDEEQQYFEKKIATLAAVQYLPWMWKLRRKKQSNKPVCFLSNLYEREWKILSILLAMYERVEGMRTTL
ncbi:uncharacterized protein LOC109911076 isoform X3 [Rhincodon typus]|uniref:uncharacterized protein LOC109911076 isoform X3 n=1 Tax=Rhincodon typus TaxID=259920 RepID=UPI00202E720B|nr:uncharacterized protein LOC109911076 isoform X3 [Rhincodon typus]